MMLLGYGCGVQRLDWQVKDRTPPSYSRVYLIDSGWVRYESGGNYRILHTGHLYIFPSFAPYTIEHDPTNPISCLWFHLDLFPTPVPKLVEIVPDEALDCLLRAARLEMGSAEPDAAYLTCLSEALTMQWEKQGFLAPPDPVLAPVLRYMAEHYPEPLNIRSLSLRFGYAPEYFIRSFKRRMGITPHQYLIGCRMNQAILLLRGQTSIGDIAQRVGYTDGKSFSNAFQKRYGLSPSLYRRFFTPQA
jgi:AraC-like DNA-binding protein